MRFATHFVSAWVFHLAEAIGAGDMNAAREICVRVSTQAPVEFNPDSPFDHAMRLVVARADNNLGWLEEAEALLADHAGRWPQGAEPYESIFVAHHLAGLMRLPDAPRAIAHFEAALAMTPDFLPARIELEILRSGRDRQQIFGALGVDIPRSDWGYMIAACQLGMASPVPDAAPPQGAICLRGLCTEHTAALVRLYKWLNPTTPIIVATWTDTPLPILQAISAYADIALAPPPETAGSQNKNRQIVLARAALLTARNAKMSHVLLVRTDIALFRPEILRNLESTYQSFPVAPGEASGRLIISDIFTRRFLPFHVSDLLTYGAIPDLMRLWSAPYEVGDVHNTTEQHIGNYLYYSLGLKDGGDIMNRYYRLVRDFFVVRDFSWFDGCWLKKPKMRSAADQAFADACISQLEWERLYHAPWPYPIDPMGAGSVGVLMEAALGISKL